MTKDQKEKLDELLYTLAVLVGQLDTESSEGLRKTYVAFANSLAEDHA